MVPVDKGSRPESLRTASTAARPPLHPSSVAAPSALPSFPCLWPSQGKRQLRRTCYRTPGSDVGSFKVDKEMNSFGPTDTAIPDLAPPPGSSLAQLAPEAKRMRLGVSLPEPAPSPRCWATNSPWEEHRWLAELATQEKHPAPQAPHPIHPRKKAIISESPGHCLLPPSPNLFQIQGESEARAPAATPALTLHTAQHRSTRSTWQLIRWDLTS